MNAEEAVRRAIRAVILGWLLVMVEVIVLVVIIAVHATRVEVYLGVAMLGFVLLLLHTNYRTLAMARARAPQGVLLLETPYRFAGRWWVHVSPTASRLVRWWDLYLWARILLGLTR